MDSAGPFSRLAEHLDRYVEGIRLSGEGSEATADFDASLPDLIDALPELLGPEADAELAHRQEAASSDTERHLLAAGRQVLDLCRIQANSKPLRDIIAGVASPLGDGEWVAKARAFLTVAASLEDILGKDSLWGASLAVARSALMRGLSDGTRSTDVALGEAALATMMAGLDVLRTGLPDPDVADKLEQAGCFWLERPVGDTGANIEQALSCFQDALHGQRRLTIEWARISSNLAYAYNLRIAGDRSENIEHAIKSARDALRVFTPDVSPELCGKAQTNLGIALLARERGNRTKNVESARACFERCLPIFTLEDDPYGWARTRLNIGNTYLERLRGDPSDNIEQAIAHYQQALAIFARDGHLPDEATTLRNLGAAYVDRTADDWADNLDRAIEHYRRALAAFDRLDNRIEWARTCTALGEAFCDRVHGKRADNVEASIDHLQQALTVLDVVHTPREWAAARNALGIAFDQRVCGDRAENIELAIANYLDALTIAQRETDAHDWAATCINLANAYCLRLRGHKDANLELAIARSLDAHTVMTPDTDPEGWADASIALGTAYLHLGDDNRASNIERAIRSFKDAISVYTKEADPYHWAMCCCNLGNAYSVRRKGREGDNRKKEISNYEAALSVLSGEPNYVWAPIRRNLGLAYAARIEGVAAADLERAAGCLSSSIPALKQFEPTGAASLALGRVLLELGRPDEALAVWRRAMADREALFNLAVSREARAQIAHDAGDLVSRLAMLELACGKVGEAAVTLERGRALRLRQALALDEAWLAALPDREQARIVAARDRLAALREAQPQPAQGLLPDQIRAWEKAVRQAARALKDAQAAAGFAPPKPLSAARLAALAPANGALVFLVCGPDKGAAIVLPGGCRTPAIRHVVECAEADAATLREILRIWLEAYQGCIRDASDARDPVKMILEANAVLEGVLDRLWDMIMQPILAKAADFDIQPGAELVLLPQGDLALLPLHAAGRLSAGRRHSVIDDYVVSYAPSATALRTAHERVVRRQEAGHIDAQGRGRDLLGIFNPMRGTDDELFSAEEQEMPALVEVFKRLHHCTRCCVGQEEGERDPPAATLERVVAEAPDYGYVHFACHGRFHAAEPGQSGLQLAGDMYLTVDGIVRALKLPANRWVALSACETAMVDVQQLPDEFIGLPAALMQAGAPGVVATLWSVYEHPAAHVMPRVYAEHLERGLPPAAAVRQAVLSLRTLSAKSEQRSPAAGAIPRLEVTAAPHHSTDPPCFEWPVDAPIMWAAFCYFGI